MNKCNLCNKDFIYKSKLIQHQNSKKACTERKKKYKCEICNIECVRPSELERHKNSKKCIQKTNIYNITNNIDNSIDNSITNIYNTFINLTLNINTFQNTNLSFIRKLLIKDVVDNQLIKNLEQAEHDTNVEALVLKFMDGIIEIFKHLNFNINITENHNCKILSVLQNADKKFYEYLIIEIINETKFVWRQIEYEGFISELIKLMYKIADKIKDDEISKYIKARNIDNTLSNEEILKSIEIEDLNNYSTYMISNGYFIKTLDYITEHLLNNKIVQQNLKVALESKFYNLFMQFAKENNLPERVPDGEDDDTRDLLNKYMTYRNSICKFKNGCSPDVLDSYIGKMYK